MNKKLLNTGVQDFIFKNIDTDIVSVLFKKPIFDDITQQELVQQIESKKKCQKKLPTWYNTPGIYYPKKIHIEQTSSEITATYKSKIVNGKSLVDLTGGLGIDSYYFNKKIVSVLHFEIDEELAKIASHNFQILETKNIQNFIENGIDFLKNSNINFDWLYLDPSRRNESKEKVFRLSDCQPNIVANLEVLYNKSENILLKTSPLLDISIGLEELHGVKEVHIIAINNDVKELLWVLNKEFAEEVSIKTINFSKLNIQTFDFKLIEEKSALSIYDLPSTYLYEPNNSILKSGAFKSIGLEFGLKKLHPNTHLYTSNQRIEFPGRRFNILKIVPYNTKGIKELNISKANITTRNFPDSVAAIRKKFKIKEGGNSFLFFFKNLDNVYQVALCDKI